MVNPLESLASIIPDIKPWHLDDYINNIKSKKITDAAVSNGFDRYANFHSICAQVRKFFNDEWDEELQSKGERKEEIIAERHKRALIGYPAEVNYFKAKIRDFLKSHNLENENHPSWYDNLVDAIFHENWGLAGIAQWMSMKESSSAKIIGDRIYYFINGKAVLQEQKISPERFEKLRKALLLPTPKKRLDEQYSEVFMHSGERIAIYYGDLVFEGQNIMVFRKYIVDKLTFEEQAHRGTIPFDCIPFLKAMVAIGPNVAFVGRVRSGKTTFLSTYQAYEDHSLEGIAIQNDPEIPFHKYYPDAPIISLIADGTELRNITKKIVRSDADYIIMAEARDAHDFNCLLETGDKGTTRCKTTIHLRKVANFCYNIASKIQQEYGGSLDYLISKVADTFNYIFEFISLPNNRAQKRLKGIYEIQYQDGRIEFHQICKYNAKSDCWTFKYDIGNAVKELGQEENAEAFRVFQNELKILSEKFPMEGDNIIIPFYGNTQQRRADQ